MNKKMLSVVLAALLVLSMGLAACSNNTAPAKDEPKANAEEKQADEKQPAEEKAEAKTEAKEEQPKDEVKADAPKPGESGFNEIPIGEDQIVGPFQVAAVYFQGVDMVPENKQPSAEESDMHLEADIHMTPEAAKEYGFGDGEDIWPAYLTVNYKVETPDGKEVTSGTFMPMNADDGAHYGINIRKNVIAVGKYKLIIEIQPSQDYLLHVDSETGVPVARENGKDAASKYYQKQTVTFDWDYDGSQLANK